MESWYFWTINFLNRWDLQVILENSNDFLFFLRFIMLSYGISRAFIIPKWLMLAPGHIAILFGSVLELPKTNSTKSGPVDPIIITKTLQKKQEKSLEQH